VIKIAQIGLIETFHASHGSKSHEHDFKIEVVLEGKIDESTEFVQGIDHYAVITELKKVISSIENKNLKEVLTTEGYKSSGNESIARYFLNLLKDKFPVKYIKIWETENRYAIIFSKEI
jgi:6-pyruvoyl-tetrahydropterin synthase